jgi:hypothetical protein
MKPSDKLEKAIKKGVIELKGLLEKTSTLSMLREAYSYNIKICNSCDKEIPNRLVSPAKQWAFLLSLLMSTKEPKNPIEYKENKYKDIRHITNDLFSDYLILYFPSEEDSEEMSEDWYRVREVALPAFLHHFNTSLMASPEQVVNRVRSHLVPFDSFFLKEYGIDSTQSLSICEYISKKHEEKHEDIYKYKTTLEKIHLSLLDKAEKEKWNDEKVLNEIRNDKVAKEIAGNLLQQIDSIGMTLKKDIIENFGSTGEAFLKLFSIARGEGAVVEYPTGKFITEERPLVFIDSEQLFCYSVNNLYCAILSVFERTIGGSDLRAHYFQNRDKVLEREGVPFFKALMGPKTKILSNVFENDRSEYEHDIIAYDGNLCLVIEAKATPPIEPFRDPEKAYKRLKDAFYSDRGIQKAFLQANRIVRRLDAGEEIDLYDCYGKKVETLIPREVGLAIGVCLTRDNYGPLGTDLKLLLQKEQEDKYPWVMNILDLECLAEAWKYFKYETKKLKEYLETRILLHGKVFSTDELDFVGFFLRHGGLEQLRYTKMDLAYLEPSYSDIFDEVYKCIHCKGPAVEIQIKDPTIYELRKSPALDKPVCANREEPLGGKRRVGRNDPCPCGSGRKYKHCCGRS